MSPRFIIATLTLIIGLLAGWLLFQTQEQPEDYKGAKNSIQVPLEYVPSNPASDRQKNGGNSGRNTEFRPQRNPIRESRSFFERGGLPRFPQKTRSQQSS